MPRLQIRQAVTGVDGGPDDDGRDDEGRGAREPDGPPHEAPAPRLALRCRRRDAVVAWHSGSISGCFEVALSSKETHLR